MLRATKENEEILKKYTELIKRRLEFGEVTKTDLEQSKSRYYTMQSNRIQADGNYKVSKALYKKIFGIDPKQLSIPKNYPKIPKTFDELKKLAQEGNLDLQISKLTTVVAKYDITRATNKLLPSVSFSYNRLRGDENLQLNGFKEQKTYEIGLNVPIFPNGGSEYTNIIQAKYNFNKTYYDYEDYKLDLERQIVATWNDVKTYNANVEASKIALEFTTITLDAVKREAQYGSRTTLDVLNAELDNFNASVNLIQARYSQVLSYYNLLALIGTLNQKIFNNEIAG